MATYPTPPKTTTPTPKPAPKPAASKPAPRPSGGGSTAKPKAKAASGGSGGDPYARMKADQKAQEAKAAARLSANAAKLRQQAEALKLALGAAGFQASLKRELDNANKEFWEEDAHILSQYERGKKTLLDQAGTSEDQRQRSLQEAGQNAGRERMEALQQGIENGISATDMIKAQAASLRNWSFNTGQVQTNYTDEINGLQSEHAQMVNSVVTSRQAAWREREQQRSQLYRNYYDNRGQVLTEIGNKYGEAAQYYDMANEQASNKSYTGGAASAHKSALENLREAAKQTGLGYKEAATPAGIKDWKGTAEFKNSTDARQWGRQEIEVKDAEGASSRLRKWEA